MKFLGFVAIVVGISVLMTAKRAIHEIEAFILFLVALVLISASAIIDAIYGVWKTLIARLPNPEPNDDSTLPGTSYLSIARDIFIIVVLLLGQDFCHSPNEQTEVTETIDEVLRLRGLFH